MEKIARQWNSNLSTRWTAVPIIELDKLETELERLSAPKKLTHIDILRAMSEDDELADTVLQFLNDGMRDEWDCSLPQGLVIGFGNAELRIAAKSALISAEHRAGQIDDQARHNGKESVHRESS